MSGRIGRVAILSVVFALTPFPGNGGMKKRPRAIIQCPWNGTSFSLYDAPQSTTIGTYDLVTIDGKMLHTDAPGAIFTIHRSGQVIFQKRVDNIFNQNGWLGVSDDFHSFAFNTSDGGAIGGWSITILRIRDDGKVVDLSDAVQSVKNDFSARHSCKTRGNNYEAIQWRSNDQLLISASVYPTGDCGKELGYTEGYVLNVTTGQIVAHVSEQEMLNLLYVCTYNVWQPGDPKR